ncbi:MAG: hypothetical protein QM784_04195 [Polyangiaceae bacterium]
MPTPSRLDERTLASPVLTSATPTTDSGEAHRPRYTLDPREMLSGIVTDRRRGLPDRLDCGALSRRARQRRGRRGP